MSGKQLRAQRPQSADSITTDILLIKVEREITNLGGGQSNASIPSA
jgi:hypothetical protein